LEVKKKGVFFDRLGFKVTGECCKTKGTRQSLRNQVKKMIKMEANKNLGKRNRIRGKKS